MANQTATFPTPLPGTAKPVGFGTASLARLDDPLQIGRMLSGVYESGVRHFDTAPLYGHGTMEGQLGRVLRGHREEVTIATKFGLEPPLPRAVSAEWLGRIKRVVKRIGFLRRGAQALAAKHTTASYRPVDARKSLERSLRELGTGYVDILLIHEGSPEEVSDEALLAFLEEEKKAGRVRAFGLAAQWATAEQLPPSVWKKFDVLQIPGDATTDHVSRLREHFSGLIITHSVFAPLARLRTFLEKSAAVREEWSARLSMDFKDSTVLPRLLWQAALRQNRGGITLFSTIDLAHAQANVREMQGPLPDEILRDFVVLASAVTP